MGELALLWLFTVLILIVLAIAVLLALGVVFGVVWLVWRALRFAADTLDCWIERRPAGEVKTNVVTDSGSVEPRVPGRVRGTREGRLVRVPRGLVPSPTCLAKRDLGGVERRRQAGAR